MENAALIQTGIVIAVLAVVGFVVGIWFASRNRHTSQKLREKFGPEYDLTMENTGSQRKAEQALGAREKRVTKLDVRELTLAERERYHTEWVEIQANFVDDPSKSLENANRLITEVMVARGFPVADFDQRAEDLSVLYPNVVTNYRGANAVALKSKSNEASTEDLRQAMVSYRSMFEELLGKAEVKDVVEREKEVVIQ